MSGACKNCGRWLNIHEMESACPVCGSRDRIVFGIDSGAISERETVARELASKHYEIEDGLTHVYWITSAHESESSPTEPIKLLEANENTIPSGIMPIQFGPSPASGVFYPSVIVEVTPSEFAKIQSGELLLPQSWSLGEEIPKSTQEGD